MGLDLDKGDRKCPRSRQSRWRNFIAFGFRAGVILFCSKREINSRDSRTARRAPQISHEQFRPST
jgi:hypothetical protein